MDVAVLRCQSCMAPIDLQQGPVQHCTYCGAALVVRAGGSPAAALAAIPQELRLLDAGRNKIGVIKVICEHTGLGLVEAKDLAEKVPAVVARWDDATRIEAFRAALVAAGARVG